METDEIYDLYQHRERTGEEIFVHVQSKRTGTKVWIDVDGYVNGLGHSTNIFGHSKPDTNSSGWYFSIDELEVCDVEKE